VGGWPPGQPHHRPPLQPTEALHPADDPGGYRRKTELSNLETVLRSEDGGIKVACRATRRQTTHRGHRCARRTSTHRSDQASVVCPSSRLIHGPKRARSGRIVTARQLVPGIRYSNALSRSGSAACTRSTHRQTRHSRLLRDRQFRPNAPVRKPSIWRATETTSIDVVRRICPSPLASVPPVVGELIVDLEEPPRSVLWDSRCCGRDA